VTGSVETAAGLPQLTYRIRSTEVFDQAAPGRESRVALKADGSFAFVAITRGLKGPQELLLRATSAGGLVQEAAVPLLPGESDVPGFRVEPGDGRLTLSWESLPGAATQTLLYQIQNPGRPPARREQAKMTRSPHVLSGLQNGNRYTLQLRVGIPGEPDAWSKVESAVPFSPDTLTLSAFGEYRRIRLSWQPIPASGSYEIWRATDADGEYARVGGPVAESSFLDEDVRYGQRYFYRVQAAEFSYAASRVASAEMTGLAEQRVETFGFCALPEARDLCADGAYLFAAAGPQGLQVVDLADPRNPTVIGTCPTGNANAVAVRGALACVADGSRGLLTLDVSDPRNPRLLGARKTTEARAVYLKDRYAFVADGPAGLRVLDLSNPSAPMRVATLDSQDARDIAGRGSLVFLADGRGGLLTVDAADPAAPVLLGRLPSRDARALALCGELVLLADGEQGLMVIDVSRPGEPALVGSCGLSGALDVASWGRLAYLARGQDGITAVDLTDPQRPTASATWSGARAFAVEALEEYACLADHQGLRTVRVMVRGISYPVASTGRDSKAFRISLSGRFAYLAGHDAGVSVIEVSSPAAVAEQPPAAVHRTEYAMDVEVANSRLYVADGRRGIKIIDLATDARAGEPTALYTGGSACGLAVAGETLFVATGAEGLKIIDLSNPREPAQIAEFPSRDARDVAVLGDRLLLADAEEGLILLNVSNPASPLQEGSLPALRGYRLAVRDGRAFVAGPAGMHVIELEPESGLRLLATYPSHHAEDVAVEGVYAYLAEGHLGLTVLDVSRPEHPRAVSTCPEVYAVGVAARDGYAFVTDAKGLQVIRVLVPEWLRPRASDALRSRLAVPTSSRRS
jgi:hypothetical protein